MGTTQQQRQDRIVRAGGDRATATRMKHGRHRPDRGRLARGDSGRGGQDRPRQDQLRQHLHTEDGPAAAGDGALLTLARARDALRLDYDEFDLAVQIGEVATVACGSRTWKVRPEEIARLSAETGCPQPLLDRVRLVGSAEAAKELGVGRERFVRLARAGHIRPVRWYVNRYHALVWMYLARDVRALAERSPALLSGPLPEGLRAAVADGEDERARGWRSRRVAQLVRDAYDAWDEAAVWSALLGQEFVDSVVPDPYERAHLSKLRAALPPGRPGLATPEQIKAITTADHPDEITLALVSLADALGRARKSRPAPGRPPGTAGGLVLTSAARPGPQVGLSSLPPLPEGLAGPAGAAASGGAHATAPVGPARSGSPAAGPTQAGPPAGPAGSAAASEPPEWPGDADDGPPGLPGLRGLLRLLARRRRPAGMGEGARPGGRGSGGPHNSPTSVSRTTARPSSSDAARSTSAEMPQP
jgi:hypothetical protein